MASFLNYATLIRICLPLFMVFFLSATPVAQAQTAAPAGLSAEYLTGLAFYKFAGVDPDFKTWVVNSQAYKDSTPHDRADMIREEVPHLQNTFSNYMIEDNPITIKVKATFVAPSAVAAKTMLADKKKITIPVKLTEMSNAYFPLQVGEMWIALIPKDLEKMLEMTFTADEYEAFRRRAAEAGMIGRPCTLILTMVPIKADITAPLQVNDFSLWMLMAEIIKFELWSQDGKKFGWYLNVPGQDKYMQNDEINNLFGQ